jgi:hypothetical protein
MGSRRWRPAGWLRFVALGPRTGLLTLLEDRGALYAARQPAIPRSPGD